MVDDITSLIENGPTEPKLPTDVHGPWTLQYRPQAFRPAFRAGRYSPAQFFAAQPAADFSGLPLLSRDSGGFQ